MQTKFAIFLNLCGKDSQIPHDIVNLIIDDVREINKGDVWLVAFCENKRNILLRHIFGPTLILKMLFTLNPSIYFYDSDYFVSDLMYYQRKNSPDIAFSIFLHHISNQIPRHSDMYRFTAVDCSIENIRYLQRNSSSPTNINLLIPVLKMRNYIAIWTDLHT